MLKLQQSQLKKIHFIDLTGKEFKEEIEINKNKAYIDALKKGVILFGQEDYVKFIMNLYK